MASFWLEYEQNGALQRFPFDAQTISIGRDKSSDFVLDHPTVSRQHALIMNEGGGVFRLIVLSRGGLTALEGQPVESEIPLYDDALLHIGRLSFRFRSDFAPKRPASAAPAPASQPMGAPGGFAGSGGPSPGLGAGPGIGASPGFGGGLGAAPPSQAFGGAQPPGGGFGTPGGLGQTPAPQAGFGQMPSMQPAAPAKEEKGAGDGGGIVSWDDIAQSDAATADDGGKASTDYDKIRKASAKAQKGSEGNPVMMIVGVLAIVGMLVFIFLPQDDGLGGGGAGGQSFEDLPPVEIEVSCLGEADCLRQAKAAYRLGVDLIERRDVENRNLFDGYKRLLEAKELLAQAGIAQPPEDMNRLTPLHDQARADLDQLFRGLRMRYNQLETNRMHQEMVDVLTTIQAFFPDRTAREHRWAVAHEREMRRTGIYPRADY